MAAVLFVDANQYLNLYRMIAGKKLLATLQEQRGRIFVPRQVVYEVERNKLRVAAEFLSDILKNSVTKMNIPDHLFNIREDEMAELRRATDETKATTERIESLAIETLHRISASLDDVSARLKTIFNNAVEETRDELERATERKLRGNPPGKNNDPLGDQISWEQVLNACRKDAAMRLWVITRDRDYGTRYADKLFLNAFLRQEAAAACPAIELYCFDDLLKGLQHFAANAGVEAKQLPTEEEAKDIEKEIEALPQSNTMAPMTESELEILGRYNRRLGIHYFGPVGNPPR